MRVIKIIIVLLLTTFVGFSSLLSQNSKVSNAIQAFSDGEYEKTYELAGDALASIDELSGDYIAAAYYYLAKSRVQVLRLAMENRDQEKLQSMQNALIESYFDYMEALKTADHKLQADIQNDLNGLFNPILQTGLSALNTGNNTDQPENVRHAALLAAKGYLEAAWDISPTYLACDLLGQAKMALGDTATAYEHFSESTTTYKQRPPIEADFLMAYVFFRKAIIERYWQNNNGLALATLMDGENMLNTDYSRHSLNGTLSPQQRMAYDHGIMDLIGFELDIYLNDPTLREDALVRFQEVLILYPEDYNINLAYANILENVDALLSIDAYKTAISIDDSQDLAYFNIGAVYNNLGSEAYLQGLNQDDDIIADSLYNDANLYFRNAFTYMEQAYQLNSHSLQTIRALIQLSNSLGLDEKAAFYEEKEVEVRGF